MKRKDFIMSRRMEKINELLQQELSLIIQKEMVNNNNFFVTVQGIRTAKDLKTANVWVSIFGANINDDQKKELIRQLQKKSFVYQKTLSQRMDIKYIPRLKFRIDISGEAMQKIDEIIKNSDKQNKSRITHDK